MARRTKRRPKFTWFPVSGTNRAGDDGNASGREFAITLGSGADVNVPITIITPLTFDFPADPDQVDVNSPGVLAGIVGQEYVIERIVGNIHAFIVPARQTGNDPGTVATTILGMGIFVARADDANPSLPIGANVSSDLLNNEYGVLEQDTQREPWMFRRTWMLHNPAFTAAMFQTGGSIVEAFINSSGPWHTGMYGDANSGPFVDVRSVRRVGQDDRLWLALSLRAFPNDQPNTVGVLCRGIVDLRILGQLRKARNDGKF